MAVVESGGLMSKIIKVTPVQRSVPRQRVIRNEPMVIQEQINNLNKQIKDLKAKKKFLNKQLQQLGSRPIRSEYFDKPIVIYVLELENQCWYIGCTRNIDKRMKAHHKGKGAIWTKANKPIRIHEIRESGTNSDSEAGHIEDEVTLEYAKQYGIDKVRGGGYCQTKPRWPRDILEPDLSWIH